MTPDASGMIGPETPLLPSGASAFADPLRAPLKGHYHRLPQGTLLPEGLGVVADGRDVDPMSHHSPTHHTIYPTMQMPWDQFIDLFKNLPWEYGGKR